MSLPKEPRVKAVYKSYPREIRDRLYELRELVLEVAAEDELIGPLEETLKWGEPAYLTSATRSGSTIRLAPVRGRDDKVALFFNCQTDLVSTFRDQFGELFEFEGNRAVILDVDGELPVEAVSSCVRSALTYHARKKRR